MEFVVTLIAGSLAIQRTWRNPLYPFVFMIYYNTLKYWLSLRIPFFYSNKYLIDLFFIGLLALAFLRHVLPNWRSYLRMTSIEAGLIFVVAYSWISYLWSPDIPYFVEIRQDFVRYTFLNELIYLIFLPLMLRAGINRLHEIPNDFVIIGLTILPLVGFSLEWIDRGASYLFDVIDPITGDTVKIGDNPLNLAFFSCEMILVAVFFMRRSLFSVAAFTAILVFASYLLVQSQTRGQMVATILNVIIFLPVLHRYIRKDNFFYVLPALFFALGIALLFSTSVIAEILTSFGFDESYANRLSKETMIEDMQARAEYVTNVTNAWASSPFAMIFGLGTTASYFYTGAYIHNVVLEILYEQGLFVWIIYLSSLARAAAITFKTLLIPEIESDDRRMLVFFSAQLVILFIVSLKEGALYNSFELLLAVPYCAIFATHLQDKYAGRHTRWSGAVDGNHASQSMNES